MSELSDATQLLIVTGRGAYLLGNITVKSAILVLKVLNTIYLAKWKGKVSLNRFRRICGGDFTFVNLSSEDAKILRGIEQEMKAHGILFARLPDLCGGDGRTQYVIPPADIAKMKAFLLDHSKGAYAAVKAGLISPADYAHTGVIEDGQPTQELAQLTQSALSANRKQKNKEGNSDMLTPDQVLQVPEVWDAVKKHDAKINFGRHVSWIKGEPLKEHENWGLYSMPDNRQAVMIPKADIIPARKHPITGKRSLPQFAVYDAKDYMTIDLQSGEKSLEKGRDVVLAFSRSEQTVKAGKETMLPLFPTRTRMER